MFAFILRYFATEQALAKRLYKLYSTLSVESSSIENILVNAVKKKFNTRKLLGTLLKDAYEVKKLQTRRQVRKKAKETSIENMRNYKSRLRARTKEITQYQKDRSKLFRQIGYFNNSSWLTAFNKPDKLTMKGTNKWYSIQGLNDNLIDKMASSVSAGKFLWNTLWLHKRRWTKPKHGKSIRFNQSTLNTFSDVRNKIVKSGKLPKRFTQSIKPIVRKQRYTTTFWNKLNLWK